MAFSPKDNFSKKSDCYARYRPGYPQQLFDFILDQVEKNDLALDCGTGNGQAATVLSNYFKKVYAIDISSNQIENAPRKQNIEYLICEAEQTPFPEETFDLITVAIAIHWFHFDTFYPEMQRIARNNCVFACWGYNLLYTDNKDFNELLKAFYSETLNGYWDHERRFVEQNYQTIPFPFEEIKNPGFEHTVQWSLFQIEGYLGTWSAVHNYLRKNGSDPVSEFIQIVIKRMAPSTVLSVTFPIFMRIGKIFKKL